MTDKPSPTTAAAKDEARDNEPQIPKDRIFVKLFSPFQIYFNGEAKSISAENDTGPFDVLPQHHSFISLINACELHIEADDGEKRVRISHGVMHVRNNRVTVFLDV